MADETIIFTLPKEMSPWMKFTSWNRGKKWQFTWKKLDKSISFNDSGFYFAFKIVFSPQLFLHLFLSVGSFPIAINCGTEPSKMQKFIEEKFR